MSQQQGIGDHLMVERCYPSERDRRLEAYRLDLFQDFGNRLGDLALKYGLLEPDQLDECLAAQTVESDRRIPLGKILLNRRLLTTSQIVQLLRCQDRHPLICDACGRSYQLAGLPGQTVPCLGCKAPLRPPCKSQEFLKVNPEPLPCRVSSNEVWIGRFQIVREIGCGGMGLVFEAQDSLMGRRVALKLLQDVDGDGRSVKRLYREAALAGRLRNANIVTIHEVGTSEQAHYIVMEYVEGPTLAAHLKETRLNPREGATLLEAVARAVGYAHSQGIVHRDLKPANIILDPERGPMVTDFGLALDLTARSSITHGGRLVGTPYYMSPEQVKGEEAVDIRSDVYSLGVILYELLTARPPFTGETTLDVFQKIVTEDPSPPSTLYPRLSPDLEGICLKAMARDLRQRYANATEMADDVSLWLKSEPVKARRASRGRKLLRCLGRHKILIGLILASTVGIGTAILLAIQTVKEGHDLKVFREQAVANANRLNIQQMNDRAEQRLHEAERKILSKDCTLENLRPPLHAIREDSNHVLDLDPFNIRALLQKGKAYALEGELRSAEACLSKALEIDADASEVRFARARVLENLSILALIESGWKPGERAPEDFRIPSKRAHADFQFATKHGKNSWEADYARAALASPEETVRLCRDAIERGYHPHDFAKLLIIRVFAQNPMDLSPSTWELAISSYYSYPHLLLLRAYARVIGSEYEPALQDCARAAAFDPEGVFAPVIQGDAFLGQNEHGEAQEAYTEAIKRRPWWPAAYHRRSRVHILEGHWEEAIRDLTEIIRLEPGHILALVGRSNILYRIGRFTDALQDAEAAMRRDPDCSRARLARGQALVRLGRTTDATADFERFLNLSPDHEEADPIREWLEKNQPGRKD